MTKRFLYISPFFPPLAGIEVKRAITVVRHIGDCGWEPVVLAARPEPGRKLDRELAALLPDGLQVADRYAPLNRLIQRLSAAGSKGPGSSKGPPPKGSSGSWTDWLPRTWTSGYILPLDRFWVDLAWSTARAIELVRRHDLELIHVNAGPMSALVVGALASRATAKPLVADLRDPWTLQHGKAALAPVVTRWADRQFEHFAFATAAKVVLNSEACLEAYCAAYRGRIPADRFTFARNAFDRRLYGEPDDGPSETDRPFTFFHFGSFRLLVDPDALFRGYRGFLDALQLDPSQVRFGFAGKMRDRDRALLDELDLEPWVDDHGFVSLARGFELLRSAQVAVLVGGDTYRLQIPGKLYDYMAADLPIFAVTENDEVGRILESTGIGLRTRPGDHDGVVAGLRAMWEGAVDTPGPERLEPFAAPALAQKLAAIFDEACAR